MEFSTGLKGSNLSVGWNSCKLDETFFNWENRVSGECGFMKDSLNRSSDLYRHLLGNLVNVLAKTSFLHVFVAKVLNSILVIDYFQLCFNFGVSLTHVIWVEFAQFYHFLYITNFYTALIYGFLDIL